LPVYFFWKLGDADDSHATATTITLKFLKIWARDLSKIKTNAGILFLGGCEMPMTAKPQPRRQRESRGLPAQIPKSRDFVHMTGARTKHTSASWQPPPGSTRSGGTEKIGRFQNFQVLNLFLEAAAA